MTSPQLAQSLLLQKLLRSLVSFFHYARQPVFFTCSISSSFFQDSRSVLMWLELPRIHQANVPIVVCCSGESLSQCAFITQKRQLLWTYYSMYFFIWQPVRRLPLPFFKKNDNYNRERDWLPGQRIPASERLLHSRNLMFRPQNIRPNPAILFD